MATSVAGTQAATRFETLEGLRTIAAVGVLTAHVAYNSVHTKAYLQYLHHLEWTVPIFFMISGFVLFRPWVKARVEDRPPPSVSKYARRRLARIVPAFFLCLTVVLLVGIQRGDAQDHPWIFYVFGQAYRRDTVFEGLQVAWTLDAEMVFYLFLPLLALFLVRAVPQVRGQVLLAALVVLITLGYREVVADRGDAWLTYNILGTFDWMLLGMVIATASVLRPDLIRRVQPTTALVVAAVCALATGVLDLPWGAGGNYTRAGWVAQHVLYTATAVLIVLAALSADNRGKGWVRSWLVSFPMVWIGRISYGIYLWHVPMIIFYEKYFGTGVGHRVSTLPLMLWTLATAIPLGAASWYLIEYPALRSRFAR
jgi:peptidoglycan/LPS O-acetylase OafA/YrhL